MSRDVAIFVLGVNVGIFLCGVSIVGGAIYVLVKTP